MTKGSHIFLNTRAFPHILESSLPNFLIFEENFPLFFQQCVLLAEWQRDKCVYTMTSQPESPTALHEVLLVLSSHQYFLS